MSGSDVYDVRGAGMLRLLFRHSAKNSTAQEECLVIIDKAPPAARGSSEFARALNWRCYPHTGNGEHSWCLSCSPSLSVEFSVQDAGRYRCYPVHATGGSIPHGRYLFALLTENKEGSMGFIVLRVRPTPTLFSAKILYTPVDNTPHSITSL